MAIYCNYTSFYYSSLAESKCILASFLAGVKGTVALGLQPFRGNHHHQWLALNFPSFSFWCQWQSYFGNVQQYIIVLFSTLVQYFSTIQHSYQVNSLAVLCEHCVILLFVTLWWYYAQYGTIIWALLWKNYSLFSPKMKCPSTDLFKYFFLKMSAEYNSIKGYEHLCTHLYIAS